MNEMNNYYGGLFLNRPGSPIIKKVASKPNNATAIIEVVAFHLHYFHEVNSAVFTDHSIIRELLHVTNY